MMLAGFQQRPAEHRRCGCSMAGVAKLTIAADGLIQGRYRLIQFVRVAQCSPELEVGPGDHRIVPHLIAEAKAILAEAQGALRFALSAIRDREPRVRPALSVAVAKLPGVRKRLGEEGLGTLEVAMPGSQGAGRDERQQSQAG